MVERQAHWGATVGVTLAGAAACAALALLGLLGPSAVGAAALLYWLARRVVAEVPGTRPARAARPAPPAWSTYDRRRSARLPLGRRVLGALHLRRRRAASTRAPSAVDASRDLLPPGARPRHVDVPPRWRQRDAH